MAAEPNFYTVSQLARPRGIPPKKISDLFYARKLDDARCPIISGRRLIPIDYVAEIDRVLREEGIVAPIASDAKSAAQKGSMAQ